MTVPRLCGSSREEGGRGAEESGVVVGVGSPRGGGAVAAEGYQAQPAAAACPLNIRSLS